MPSLLPAETIRGRVLDPLGNGVESAEVRLHGRYGDTLRKAASGADGSYEFADVPAGDYILEADALGAVLSGSSAVTIAGDQTLDLALAVTGPDVEVIVTASSTPLLLREVAKSTDVVDSASLGLRGEYSLVDGLRSVPGLRVQQLRGPGSLMRVQTRGMRPYDTAVLVGGLRIRDTTSPQGDATALLAHLLDVDAERVEFLRGAGSTLYGSHAMAGAINISPRRGGGRPHGGVLAEGGGLGMLRGVARGGGSLAGDRFNYSGGITHLNVVRGHRGNSPYRNSSAQGLTEYALTPRLSVGARVWGSDSLVSLAESPAFPGSVVSSFPATGPVAARALPSAQLDRYEAGLPFEAGRATFVPAVTDPDGRTVSKFLSSAFHLQHQPTPDRSYRLAYHLLDTYRTYQDGPGGVNPFDPLHSVRSEYEGRAQTLLARLDQRIRGHSLASVGYEFESERYDNPNTDESPAPVESRVEIQQSSHAVYGQNQIRMLGGDLNLTLAGRGQFFRLGTAAFSGATSPYQGDAGAETLQSLTWDGAVAYFIGESQTKLRAHAGNSFRSPSLFERYGGSFSSFSGSFSYWGDPGLRPERSLALDAGIDQWIAGSKLRLSATAFYTDLRETILFDFANFPPHDRFGRFGGYRNAGGGIARGFEAGGQFTPLARTSFRASYTYANSDSRTPTIGDSFFSVPGLSAHTLGLAGTQWLGKRLSVTFDLFAVSDYSLSPFGAQGRRMVFDGPVKADAVVRYEMPLSDRKALELFGKFENVFDSDYYENGFGAPGFWATGGIRVRF